MRCDNVSHAATQMLPAYMTCPYKRIWSLFAKWGRHMAKFSDTDVNVQPCHK